MTITAPRPMPRLFVVRHGQTEWSQNGRHTGRTDIPLTEKGVAAIVAIRERLVGTGLPIDPKKLALAFVSPRIRAHRTFDLLFEHLGEAPRKIVTEEVGEWHYGDYEGLKPAEIKALKPTWTIWRDGAPNGESVSEMEARVDSVIQQIRDLHKEYITEHCDTRDVMIVAHGHFNRVLIARWLGLPLSQGTLFNVEPGSVAILSYNHNTMNEPALNALNLFASIH